MKKVFVSILSGLGWTELKGVLDSGFNTGSCIAGFDPECTRITRCLSVEFNKLCIRLSKAFGVSEVQTPLLPQHGMQNMDTKLV